MTHMPQTRPAGKTRASKKRRSAADRQHAHGHPVPSLAALRLSRQFGLSVPVASLVAALAGMGDARHG